MKKFLPIIIGVLIIIIIVAVILAVKKAKATSADEKNVVTGPGGSGAVSTKPKSVFPLKRGSTGAEVLKLQIYLNSIIQNMNRLYRTNIPYVEQDGSFGPKTEAALLQAYGLTQVSEELYNKYILNK